MEGNVMQNLKNIEGHYNAHLNAFDRACSDNNEYRNVHETAYLNAIEATLRALGLPVAINGCGRMYIEEAE